MIDWDTLGFNYSPTNGIVYSHCIDGIWEEPSVSEDFRIELHPFAGILHYSQSCFEGLKVFRGVDGKVRMFRPERNAARMADSARYLDMPYPGTDLFIEMCIRCVEYNFEHIPPHEAAASSLYLRPVLFGINSQLGIHSARDVMFIVMSSPVSTYSGAERLSTQKAIISRNYDRASAFGSGRYKLGANYAQSLKAYSTAHAAGYDELLFLDSATKTSIEEFGSSNFFAIRGNSYITPSSNSVLPSITNDCLRRVASDMGMDVQVRPIPLSEMDTFEEVNSCGTAVVISPIGILDDRPYLESPILTRRYTFGDPRRCGPVSEKLYHKIIGIQKGLEEDVYGWCKVLDIS